MLIEGKEYKFRFSVKAWRGFKDLLPDGDLGHFYEMTQRDPFGALDVLEKIAVLLSTEYERKKAKDAHDLGQTYEMHPLTVDIIEDMEVEDLAALSDEIYAVINADSKTTVEGEAPKGQKKRTADQ